MKKITLKSWIKNPFETLQKIVLPNGITIHAVTGPFSGYARSNFIFPTGSYLDENYKRGLSHFVEHTIFEEKKSILWNFTRQHGVSMNGFTNTSHNYYHMNTYENFPIFLEGGKEYSGFMDVFQETQEILFQESSIDKKIIEKQQQIISQEFYKKFPHGDKEFFKKVETFPYWILNSLGSSESIQSITLEDVVSFKKNYYRPENCTVVLVCSEVILKQVIQSLESVPVSQEKCIAKIPPMEKFFSKGSDWTVSRWDLDKKEKVLVLNNLVCDYENLEIISAICIPWIHDNLLEELREKRKLVYSVDTNKNFNQLYSMIDLRVSVDSEEIKGVQEYFDFFFETVRVNKNFFERIKNKQLRDLRCLDITTENQLLLKMRNSLVYYGKVITFQEEIDLLEKVTLYDVNNFLDFFAQNRNKHVIYP